MTANRRCASIGGLLPMVLGRDQRRTTALVCSAGNLQAGYPRGIPRSRPNREITRGRIRRPCQDEARQRRQDCDVAARWTSDRPQHHKPELSVISSFLQHINRIPDVGPRRVHHMDADQGMKLNAQYQRWYAARSVERCCYASRVAVSYVNPNTVSVSQRLNESLSMNCLNSSVSSLSSAVITRASALSCSTRAFCLSEFCLAFW